MPETDDAEKAEETTETTDTTTEVEGAVEENEPDETSGDDKEKLLAALRKERGLRKAAEKDRDAERLKAADKGKTAEELAAIKAQRDAEQAILAKANERIVRAELRAAAAGKVSNLNALARLVDIDAIDVDQDGNPSADDIEDAITTFLADFPEFAADKSKFSGSADQGTKGKQTQPRQLTREQLKSMNPEQILEAQEKGLLNDALSGKS